MRVISLVLSIVVGAGAPQSSAPPSESLEPLVFEVEFEDGRIHRQPVGPERATAWTPMFPRVAEWRPPAGQLAADAIRYTLLRAPDGLRYSVSVLLGREHQQEDVVASGVLPRDERVVVDGLLRYGVRPIVLTVRPITAGTVHLPAVVNHTAGIQVSDIAIVDDPSPRYRVTLQNLTDQAAISVSVDTRLAGRPAHSGVQGHEDGTAIVPAHGTHTFYWPFATGPQPRANRGSWSPLPVDELIITGVIWADDTFEGDARAAAAHRTRSLSRSIQIPRVVRLLQQALTDAAPMADTLQHLTQSLDTLPIDNDRSTLDAALERMPNPDLMSRDEVNRLMRTTRQRVITRASEAVAEVHQSYRGNADLAAARVALASVLQRFSAWRDRLAR